MKNTILTFLTLICSTCLSAQIIMSFKDCQNLAIKNNLLLKSNVISEKIAGYEVKKSWGNYLFPTITGTVDNRNSRGRDIDPKNNTIVTQNIHSNNGNITGNYTLFSGFLNLNQIKSSKQEVEFNKANVQKIKNDITIELAHTYIVILYLQETIEANKEQINSSEKQLEMAKLKFESGNIAESEVFKIQTQKASEELTLTSNQNQLALYWIDLKQLMNSPLDSEIILEKPSFLIPDDKILEQNQYSLTKKAVPIQPSFKMSQWNEEITKTGISIAKASYFPTLNMRFAYSSYYTDTELNLNFKDQLNYNTAKALRFTLTVPLFNQLETTYKIKQSKLAYEQAKVDRQNEGNRLSKVVLQAINDAKTAQKKQETSQTAYEFAKKSFENDQLKFESGKIDINQLNFTKINYINSQAELIRAKYEFLFNKALVNFYMGEDFNF